MMPKIPDSLSSNKMTMYSMEAVRDFTAMDSDIMVKFGEILTLILDSAKYCLVHRSDDLPFVVPKPWVVLRVEDNCRTGSFSKFLRKRECLKLMSKYPMCNYDLKSARPQFAAVTTASAATAFNEVGVEANTSVLLLNADPQNLSWFGVTQSGTFGMIPGNCLSFVTNTMTPSLQGDSRLLTTARITYEAQDPGELSITRGSSLEVIGMPHLWKWQVRVPSAKRKVGLLPVHVLNEVSVITSPQDFKSKDEATKPVHTARQPSGFDDTTLVCDPASRQILQNAGTSCLQRRSSRQPLPLRPDGGLTGSLNDLNQPTDAVMYANQVHNSFSGSFESEDIYHSPYYTLRSDKPCLHGINTAMGHIDRGPRDQARDAIDGISRLLTNLKEAHNALAHNERRTEQQLDRWKETARAIHEMTSDAMLAQDLNHAYTYSHTRHQRYGTMSTAMQRDLNAVVWSHTSQTFPRQTDRFVQRRGSVSSPLQAIEETDKNRLQPCGSQPILDMASDDHAVNGDFLACKPAGNLIHMPPNLHGSHIEVITKCICPDGAIRPKIHWKPILIQLGLDPVKAREITGNKMSPKEEWKQALQEWKQQVGSNATMPAFLEELKIFREDIYHEIWKHCGVKMIQKVSEDSECYV